MTVIKQYNAGTSQWETIVTGVAGPTGATGATGATGPAGVGAPLTSSATAPVSPSAGDLWFNTTTGATFIYYNSAWVELGGGTMSPYQATSSTRPSSPWTGQTIYETDTKIGYQYDGTNWGPTYPGSGFRNVIINGGFNVWQRSTSATTTGADSYASADRWRIRTANGGGSILSSRQSASLAGFQYCMRFQRVSGNTDTGFLQLIQTLETPMSVPLAGRDVTVSFWARKGANYSPTSSAFKVYLQSGTSTDAYWLSFTGSANLITQTTTLTSTWQKFSFTAAAGSTATQFYLQFEMTPTGTAGANDYFEITGVQLEANPQATPFEQRPIGVELDLCFRYYQRFVDPAAVGVSTGGSTVARVLFPLYTKMRAAPTSTLSGTLNYYNGSVTTTGTTITNTFNSVSQGQLDLGATIGSIGQAISIYTNGGSQYVDFSAEL